MGKSAMIEFGSNIINHHNLTLIGPTRQQTTHF
jgi:hypothetical protein